MTDESDTDESGTPLRQYWPVWLLLAAVVGVGIAATTTYPIKSGARYQTDSGMTIVVNKDTDIASGNPFGASDSVTLKNVTFTGSGGTLPVSEFNPNVTFGTAATSGSFLQVDPDSRKRIDIKGSFDNGQLRSLNFSDASSRVDVRYNTKNNVKPAIRIPNTGLSKGIGVVALDSAGNALDSNATDGTGQVVLDELPTGDFDVNLKKGPSTLEIFREREPTSLVDGQNVSLRVRFFSDNKIIQRNVSDGTVDMTGLPQDERLVVTVKGNNSTFVYRRAVLESLVQQQEVYLLNESAATRNFVFRLDDRTGNFPAKDTFLFVEKPIRKDFDGDGTNETEYRTIIGDNFGAAERFPAVLQLDQRYRLRVKNTDGDQRILGSFVASVGSGVVNVPIGNIKFENTQKKGTLFGAKLTTVNGNDTIRFQYRDPQNKTLSFTYEIVQADNESNVLVSNTTISGPLESVTQSVQEPANTSDVAWEINYKAERDGPDVGGNTFVGDIPDIAKDLGLDPTVVEYLAGILIVALTGLTVIIRDELGALTAVVSASALVFIGAIDISTVGLAVGGVVALIYTVSRTQV